jgi:cellulose synthase/poly-beta-1,6-N-acetylglucosamine synthase-like glycosyltransferase
VVTAAAFWLSAAFVVYVYAGYPLLLWLLARRRRERRRREPDPAALPTISVVIAAHDEEAVIAEKLENTLALDYPAPRRQIVVASEGSRDATFEIVERFAARGVEQSFRLERRGKVPAINEAVSRARGEIVVFSDANNFYEPDALRRLAAAFEDPRVGAATGTKCLRREDGSLAESEGLYWRYESFIKRQEARLGSCIGAAGEILAVRRALLEPIPAGVINDDFYMAMRVLCRGHTVAYVPEARSWERTSVDLQQERVRRARIVAGRFQAFGMAGRLFPWRRPLLLWQLLSHKLARPLVPWAMLVALAANVVAWLSPPAAGSGWLMLERPVAGLLLALQVVFYGVAAIGSRLKLRGPVAKLLFLPAFVVSGNVAAALGLLGYLAGRQTAVWKRVARRAPGDTRAG